MDVKIRVCLPRKYGRFMLLIDNNLLLGLFFVSSKKALQNFFPSSFVNFSCFNFYHQKLLQVSLFELKLWSLNISQNRFYKMKIKHRIIGEYATKRCFFDLRKLTIVTGS
jgi:hypothetical protein